MDIIDKTPQGDSQLPPFAKQKRSAFPGRNFWQSIGIFFRESTVSPTWLPSPWSHALSGYLIAITLQLLIVGASSLLAQSYPQLPFVEAPALFIVLLIAFTWGAGPSILTTIIGALLFATFTFPPYFSPAIVRPTDVLGILIYLIVGLGISLLATQMVRARLQAEELSQRLETVIDVLPDMLTFYDTSGVMTHYNAAGRTFIQSQENLALSDLFNTYHPRTLDGHPLVTDELPTTRALRGEVVTNSYIITRTKQDNDEHVLAVSAVPLRNRHGRIEGAVTVAHNVTELQRAEQEAAHRLAQVEAIFDAITDSIFVYDQAGHIVQANQAMRDMLALSTNPIYASLSPTERAARIELRDTSGQVLPTEQWPSHRLLAGETITGADGLDIQIRGLDGRISMASVSGAPIRDEQGAVNGAVLVLRDVTERRGLEQRTQRALQALIEMAQVMVQGPEHLATQTGTTVESSRPVMQRMAELTRQVLGCHRLSFTHVEPETELLRPLAVVGLSQEQEQQWWHEQEQQEVRLTDSPDTALVERLRANEILLLDMTQSPYADQPNPYGIRQMLVAPMVLSSRLLGFLTLDYGGLDHTYTPEEFALTQAVTELATLVMEQDRLLAETSLARANELAARSASQLKDEFIGIASHELRTPMTTMKGNLQLARRHLQRLIQQQPDQQPALKPLAGFLERIERQLERQNRLIRDLLDITRLETGHVEFRPERENLVALVQEVIEEQQQMTPTRTIHLEVPTNEALVTIDRDRVEQVISNYLSNALKYSADDQPVWVQVRLTKTDARVSVRDQGPGLTQAQQQQAWERFYRVPGIQVQSGSGVGLGLGLHISRMLIEQQGGTVGIESEPGRGATFWFTLPLAQEAVKEA